MLHKSFFISLLCATALVLLSCGGGGSGSGSAKVSGTPYSTGTFNIQVPKGWEVSPFYRSGEIVPNTLGVHKGTALEYRSMSVPCMQIQFHPKGGHNLETNAKAAYQEVKEMKAVQLGKYKWSGYTGMGTSNGIRYDLPVVYMGTEVDGAQISVAIWLEMGDKKISLDDADVKSLISSITIE